MLWKGALSSYLPCSYLLFGFSVAFTFSWLGGLKNLMLTFDMTSLSPHHNLVIALKVLCLLKKCHNWPALYEVLTCLLKGSSFNLGSVHKVWWCLWEGSSVFGEMAYYLYFGNRKMPPKIILCYLKSLSSYVSCQAI